MRYREERQAPELITVTPCPPYMKRAYLDSSLELCFEGIEFIGFSNSPYASWITEGRSPVTETWYLHGKIGFGGLWDSEYAHREKARTRSGECACEFPDCRSLGTIDIDNPLAMENLKQRAAKRVEWLGKVEARRAKAREYAALRKQRAISAA